jgi:hypothetical protein
MEGPQQENRRLTETRQGRRKLPPTARRSAHPIEPTPSPVFEPHRKAPGQTSIYATQIVACLVLQYLRIPALAAERRIPCYESAPSPRWFCYSHFCFRRTLCHWSARRTLLLPRPKNWTSCLLQSPSILIPCWRRSPRPAPIRRKFSTLITGCSKIPISPAPRSPMRHRRRASIPRLSRW